MLCSDGTSLYLHYSLVRNCSTAFQLLENYPESRPIHLTACCSSALTRRRICACLRYIPVQSLHRRPVDAVPPEAVGALDRGPPQQAGAAHVLVHRVYRLSRERPADRHKPAHHQKHRLQLHTVSDPRLLGLTFPPPPLLSLSPADSDHLGTSGSFTLHFRGILLT